MSFILAENSIPKLKGPAQVKVTINVPVVLNVTAIDDDDDVVTYTLADNNDGRHSIDNTTGVIIATFDAVKSSSLRFVSLMI